MKYLSLSRAQIRNTRPMSLTTFESIEKRIPSSALTSSFTSDRDGIYIDNKAAVDLSDATHHSYSRYKSVDAGTYKHRRIELAGIGDSPAPADFVRVRCLEAKLQHIRREAAEPIFAGPLEDDKKESSPGNAGLSRVRIYRTEGWLS